MRTNRTHAGRQAHAARTIPAGESASCGWLKSAERGATNAGYTKGMAIWKHLTAPSTSSTHTSSTPAAQ